ncbi:hypothetical protein AJ88_23495 [Mesorhizobium amorphae CCBAU 01583]|nr:hypothetical protein AJ88_23495 [Mesorhizobium amorphae CCBAU 01583]
MGRTHESETCSIQPAGLVSSPNRPPPDEWPKDVVPTSDQPSVFDPRLTVDISEPLVRGPGIGWNGAASPRQPSRTISLGK